MTRLSRSSLLALDDALHVAGACRSLATIGELLKEVVVAVPAGEARNRMRACLHVLQRGEISDYVSASVVTSLTEVSRQLHETLVFEDKEGKLEAANE